uniref:Uncharacterized protein n=1 Tax=Bos indicus x Bos taurus TaxID=30522 RepID=A0A4W2EQW1_BOBOX
MNQHLFFFVLPAQAYWKVRTKALSYADGRAWPQRPHLVRELLDAPLALPHALDRLHVALLLGLQLVLQLPHPGLQLLQLLLAALEGDLLRLVQPVLQVLDGLLHVLLHALQVRTGVALHLLLHPQGLVAAARLRVQGGLQRVHHPQVVALGLLHLLILLYQLPLNLCLDLVELQLGPEDLALFMLQGGLEGRGTKVGSQGTGRVREGGREGSRCQLETARQDLHPRPCGCCGGGHAGYPGVPSSRKCFDLTIAKMLQH